MIIFTIQLVPQQESKIVIRDEKTKQVQKMTQHILKNRIVNFSTFSCENQQQRNCHRQAFNSLMIKMSQLDRYDVVEDFTHCERQDCKMVMTNQDRDYIDDWNWVEGNEDYYNDIKDKIQKMKTNKWNYYIWNCRFCGNKNLIDKSKVYFAKNRSKVIIKDVVQSQKTAKVSESPLLLFLIDNSTSMEEELTELNENIKKKQANVNRELKAFVNDVLKKTSIYQKISENEKKILSQIKKKIDPEAKTEPYADNLTKYKVLMSMTQKVTNQLCDSKQNSQQMKINVNSSGPQAEKKIGFMFFNSDVILQKISKKNQTKVIKISHRQFEGEINKDNHLKVDFQNFHELFQIGKNNSENYGMEINNFKFSDIQLTNNAPSGQTALGPALTIASGIVSGYGSGSLIVVVTDGKANKGIFSDNGLYQQEIKLLRLKLNKARSETCLMRLQNKTQQKVPEQESTLERYFRKYSSTLTISLVQKQPLKQLYKRLRDIIQKSIKSKTWTNNIRIKCQNPNIKYNQKDIQKMKKKLFKDKQIEFISPEVNELKFTPFDYRHPFMTQIIVQYQNIETREQAKFMAYIMQKVIKYTEMNKKEQETMNSVQTLHNVLQYLEVEGEKLDINHIPLSFCQQSFRNSIMLSYKYSLQKQYQKQIMIDPATSSMMVKPHFKNPKQYIKSLTEKKSDGEQSEQQNEDEVKL